MFYAGRVAYHDFEGITLDREECQRLAADLGDRNVMILRNHGLLVCGRSIGDAFAEHYMLQRACEVQVAAQATGVPLVQPRDEIAQRARGAVRPHRAPGRPEHAAARWSDAALGLGGGGSLPQRCHPPTMLGFACGSPQPTGVGGGFFRFTSTIPDRHRGQRHQQLQRELLVEQQHAEQQREQRRQEGEGGQLRGRVVPQHPHPRR